MTEPGTSGDPHAGGEVPRDPWSSRTRRGIFHHSIHGRCTAYNSPAGLRCSLESHGGVTLTETKLAGTTCSREEGVAHGAVLPRRGPANGRGHTHEAAG